MVLTLFQPQYEWWAFKLKSGCHFDHAYAIIYLSTTACFFTISNSHHGDTLIFSFAWKEQKNQKTSSSHDTLC